LPDISYSIRQVNLNEPRLHGRPERVLKDCDVALERDIDRALLNFAIHEALAEMPDAAFGSS